MTDALAPAPQVQFEAPQPRGELLVEDARAAHERPAELLGALPQGTVMYFESTASRESYRPAP